MIYIVEIPHAGRPSCWTAKDRADFQAKCAAAWQKHGDTPEGDDFDAWVAYNGHDLHAQHVFMSAEEANKELRRPDPDITGHGAASAHFALNAELNRHNELDADLIGGNE